MEGSDVCFAPVLTMQEAIDHPHNRVAYTFIEIMAWYSPPRRRGSVAPSRIHRMRRNQAASTSRARCVAGALREKKSPPCKKPRRSASGPRLFIVDTNGPTIINWK